MFHPVILLAMTTQQKILHDFVAHNYAYLCRQYPQRDMLHSAYIAVHDICLPIRSEPKQLERLLSDAYYRFLQQELLYQTRFSLPDPLFWFYQSESEPEYEPTKQCQKPELSDRDVRNLCQFIHYHCTSETYAIFFLAFRERRSVEEIAKITGISKGRVNECLRQVELLVAEKYPKFHQQNPK